MASQRVDSRAKSRGRNAGTLHEFLRNRSCCFELRGISAWDRQWHGRSARKLIDEPVDQRRFRSDDGQDPASTDSASREVVGGLRSSVADLRDARIAGRGRRSVRLSWASRQARACSRPPLPMTRIFTVNCSLRASACT